MNKDEVVITMSRELWEQIQSVMNALTLGCQEPRIQRHLGMAWYLYRKEFPLYDEQ